MVADDVTVRSFTSLPDEVDRLVRISLDEGFDFVKRLVDDWRDGSNRFDAPGEVVVEAMVGDRLVGVGGLNRDPYVDDPGVARIRHVYVIPVERGRGAGRRILVALVDQARIHFSRVRLRTTTEDAARFYLALGFGDADDEPDATHVLGL